MDTTPKDRESEIGRILGWLDKTGLDTFAIERLTSCAQARQNREWHRAIDLCWQVLDGSKTSSRTLGNADSLEGWGRMYLGAVYYCQDYPDFSQALDHFAHAYSYFSLNTRNQRVAQFARAAAHAWRGDRASFDRFATIDLMSVLRTMGIRDANELWKTLESHLSDNPKELPVSAANKSDDSSKDSKQLFSVKRREILIAENSDDDSLTYGQQIFLWIVIVLAVALCGFAVVVLTERAYALIPYTVTWALASYFLLRHMRSVVPQGHALVIEKSGIPTVAWGPDTRYCWPFIERAHALVSLYPMQYTSPKRAFSLTTDETVDLRISVYYGVNSAGNNSKNVISSVYNPQLGMKSSRESLLTKSGKKTFLTVSQIRQLWESRLLNDIVMTLNEVLPGWTYQSLAGNEAGTRTQLIDRLRDQLELRVSEWGMAIEELNIVELNKAKF